MYMRQRAFEYDYKNQNEFLQQELLKSAVHRAGPPIASVSMCATNAR